MISEKHVLDIAILAGRIMMENGAEMHRIEDTMDRIINHAYGHNIANSFVVPTAIFSSVGYGEGIRMRRISKRINNLMKIDKVNALSRQYTSNNSDLEALEAGLIAIDSDPSYNYSNISIILASAVVSGSMMMLLNGNYQEIPAAAMVGALGYGTYLLLQQTMKIRYLPDFFASLMIGILSLLSLHFGFIQNVDAVIVGGIMMLVPGVSLANSFRDFFAGHVVSGTIFLVDTFLIGSMIGFGISIAFKIL